MKLVKSLLLGSAAGLTAVAGAQAADLPVKKAAPAVEYVRVCTAYGAGFFFIPGTDTCLRLSGRARGEYQYVSTRAFSGALANGDNTGYRGTGRINLDARTATDLGTVRTFIRFEMAGATGAYLNSGSNQRFGLAYSATGIDTFNRAQQQAFVDKAFVQFAGFTAGRASSFYDFYAHDLEFNGSTQGSDVFTTNVLAYTATLGGGLLATISVEDPTYRRQPVFTYVGGTITGTGPGTTAVNTQFFTAVPFTFDATGAPITFGNLDSIQRNQVPDVIGVLRLDQSWGSAQLSAGLHQINTGKYQGVFTATPAIAAGASVGLTGTAATVAAGNFVREPDAAYGFGVQAGVKINLPQIAAGDVLWLQAAYSQGALSYSGAGVFPYGRENNTLGIQGRFPVSSNDAVVDRFGRLRLTESASVTAAFLHYHTPQIRQAVFGSYAYVDYDNDLRTGNGPANLIFAPGTAAARSFTFSPTLRDYDLFSVGSNLIYSPVKDLDIGVEAAYSRVDIDGRVNDQNKNLGFLADGTPRKTVTFDDLFLARLRIQRDF